MNKKYSHLKIKILAEEYHYVLAKKDSLLDEFIKNFLLSTKPLAIFISEEETSFLLPRQLSERLHPEKIEPGWSCFRIIGPMPFGTVQGLIATISNTLMQEQIGICVVSTFKSDWFFIKSKYLEKSVNLLTAAGWIVEQEDTSHES